MWDLDRISWELSKIKYIGAFQLPDISLQDPIGTKENHVGSCRNGVQDPVRDLGKLGLPNKLNPPITEAQNLPEAQKF